MNAIEQAAEKVVERDSRRCLRFLPASEFLKPPMPPEWIIDGIAEVDSFCVLYGDPESGKSFMGLDWACCISANVPWKGRKVRTGPVLYVLGEGHSGWNRRVHAWGIVNGVDMRHHPLFVSSTTTALTDEVAREELLAVVAEFIREHGTPMMVVIDTLARNFGPGDENSTADMGRAVGTIDAIREMTGAWVVVVHHSGHGDKSRARGSIVLRASADTEFRLTRATPGGDTLLEATKTKDGGRPMPMSFRFADVDLGVQDEHGHEVTSAVLVPLGFTPTPQGTKTGRGQHQKRALDVLRDLVRHYEGPVLVDTWRTKVIEAGVPRQRFYDIRNTLSAGNLVVIDGAFASLSGGVE